MAAMMSACRELIVEPTGADPECYHRGLRALAEDGAPFLVGGGLAIAAYCGIRRFTKDLDVFVTPEDVAHVLDVLAGAGFRTEIPYPHWLAKAHADDRFIDLIFGSGNGATRVDAAWFAHAQRANVFGVEVGMCPAEETLWTKAFVMERERFDGADVLHLLVACAESLDYERLLKRFGEHWRVLFAHLVLYGYAFPGEADRIPRWLTDELLARMRTEQGEETARLCRGTLLSREQYLPDLARGWHDARLQPTGSMSPEAITLWTNAIGS